MARLRRASRSGSTTDAAAVWDWPRNSGRYHQTADPPGFVKGVWSHLKGSLGNLAAATVDQLAAIVRSRLKRIQYRPDPLAGFLAQTGLTLDPEPP